MEVPQPGLVAPLVADDRTTMTTGERAELLLSFARVLHVNGESTDETIGATGRLAHRLDLNASLQARWGELQLQSSDGDAAVVSADPTGVEMDRVVSARRAAAVSWV